MLRARLHAVSGNRVAASRLMAGLGDSFGKAWSAAISIALGDHEGAFADLDRAVRQRALLPCTWSNPELDPLRSDPRFARLVSSMGLPVDRLVALGRKPAVASHAGETR